MKKKILISLFFLLASFTIWGQGGGYGSGAGYPSNSLIAQGVVTYYRNTTQGGNAPKWYDINATGTAYISRDSTVTSIVRGGTATLSSGTITISDATITANSYITATYEDLAVASGILTVTKNAGVGFTIKSVTAGGVTTLLTDNNKIVYMKFQ